MGDIGPAVHLATHGFHLLNGLRHLFWDAGYGFELPLARKTGWAAAIGAIVLTVVLWAVLATAVGGGA